MKRTIKIMPKENDLHLVGRIYREPQFNSSKTVVTITVIRNFGGDKGSVTATFTMFKPKDKAFPEFIKKGAAVEVHAYVNPNHWTDKNGQERDDIQYVVKTIKEVKADEKNVLPAGNNISFAGRIYGNIYITGNVARFSVIRNFGGDKSAAVLDFVMFKKDAEQFPEQLQSKNPVTVKAYFNPNTWTDSNGNQRDDVQFVVKSLEKAVLTEKTIEVDTPQQSDEEGVDIVND